MNNSIIQRASCQPYEVAASGSVKDNLIAQSHLQTQKMSDNYFLEVTKRCQADLSRKYADIYAI